MNIKSYLFAGIILFNASDVLAHELLPIGDGKISTSPKVGYIYSCQTNFIGGGASRLGDWVQGNYWDPSKKPTVQGSVNWPDSEIAITLQGNERVISANNLPKHPTGIYPIQSTDPAYYYDRNPNAISSRNVLLKLPANPEIAEDTSCVPMGMIGFTIAGTALFNSLDGGGRDAAYHEIQDKCSGHPERSGQYHYHSYSSCMSDKDGDKGGHSSLVGYAIDGFGIYGLKGENGKILKNEDLDACHGHKHAIKWDGKAKVMYHYHFTKEYPYSIGCFMGNPVKGLSGPQSGTQQAGMPDMQGNMGQGMQDRPGSDPRGQILEMAAKDLGVSTAALRDAVGPPPPNFEVAAKKLGVSAEKIRNAMMNARNLVMGGR